MTYSDIRQSGGFTLIELITVIALISVTFFFVVPRFSATVFNGNLKETARWVTMSVKSLKIASAKTRTRYTLNIDVDTNRLWVTNEHMKDEDVIAAIENGYEAPEDVNITDVELPEKGKIASGIARICFYGKGYSDKAIIHIADRDDGQFSLVIEPFLPEIKLHETYEGFE